jgi:Tol biopolymer transport system component
VYQSNNKEGRKMKTTKTGLILILAIAGLLLSGTVVLPQQTSGQLYEKAIYLEEATGELQQAIDLYQDIINKYPEDRQVVAKALLHAGLCHEKLGLKDARQFYNRLINEYAENRKEVSVARERLTKLEQTLASLNQQPNFRKIAIASKPQNGVLSPDGKKLAFTSENAVWVVPLQGNIDPDIAGEPICIANIPGATNVHNWMTWSANGKWIAVNSGYEAEDYVYIIPVNGGEQRKVRLPNRGAGGPFSFFLSLSPDGGNLAFSALTPDISTKDTNLVNMSHIYVIPSAGGEPKRISSVPGTSPSFSPDGKLIAYITHYDKKEPPKNVLEARHSSELWLVNLSDNRYVRLDSAEGRLAGPVWSPDGRFIATQGLTGSKEVWIYPLTPDKTGAGEPAIIELPGWSFGNLSGWTPDNELGLFIRSEYHSAVYTVPSSGGKAFQVTPAGVVYYPRWSPDGKNIFLRWVKPDEVPPVQIASVPAAGGNITKIPWPEIALMSRVPGGGHNISPDGRNLIVWAIEEPYGPTSNSGLYIIPLDESRHVRLTNDKIPRMYPCWSPDGKWISYVESKETLNDKWYNAIYRIPAEGGEPVMISSAADNIGDGAIAFSPDGSSIAFFSEGKIKTIPVEGGETSDLVNDVQSGRHSNLVWSPDGSKIAYNAQSESKIWIITLATGDKTVLKTGLPENLWVSEFDWSPDGEKITFMTTSDDEPEFHLISSFMNL